jgi:ubiquinone/menaquinone biosynthesis C-methylase UbiE
LTDAHQETVRREFDRAAPVFAERSAGRFNSLNVVEFARVKPGQTVLEVGAGTGNFISLFSALTDDLIALDLTPGMLEQARLRHPKLKLVLGDAFRLPLRTGSFDLAATAQALHHIWKPVDVLKELRRVVSPDGRVLIVDSVATEKFEEVEAMNELDRLRDPSHAAFRSPLTMKVIVESAGLSVVDERLHEEDQTFSNWMWPGEFPQERIERVREFIETRGHETGLGFERIGDDFRFTRRRMMLLAER